ncbi:hypothetical protein D9758_016259 [Tetrapyrgos nigripes]|uniref:Uncharacterized protein n=1 Tax=Tetrapyrgos nigripes TaxID=182062 RepID=A0A8H5FCT3_9AGAR|nr:hypothetical protein D9758_016259 [Tetrapyrgos nigripes]
MPVRTVWLRRLVAIFVVAVVLLFLTFAYLDVAFLSFHIPKLSFNFGSSSSCSPHAFSTGQWVYNSKTNKTSMTNSHEALEFAGLAGCASSREFYWHLASDKPEQWDRFPRVSSWDWVPNSQEKCSIAPFTPESFVRTLVNDGGWLVIGDSISEGHFFSLSCSLFPHVIATPDYSSGGWFDRAWPQNMYLNPESQLIRTLSLPAGFNISTTPLVTFRRVDLLWTQEELEKMHKELYPEKYPEMIVGRPPSGDNGNGPQPFKLFSDEKTWSLSPSEYVDIFTKSLPEANYGTLIIATAGHWTTTLFSGYRDESKESEGYGIEGVIQFFEKAMQGWADVVQKMLDAAETERPLALSKDSEGNTWRGSGTGRRKRRQVVIRAYLTGHEGCHEHRDPWKEIQPFEWSWYNWRYIDRFNEAFQNVVSKPNTLISITYPLRDQHG